MGKIESEILLESLWADADRGLLAIFALPLAKAEFFNLAESDALVKATEAVAASNGNQNLYHTLGLFKDRPTGRGEESDVIGIPALWMDIDIAGQAHKKGDLPLSIQEAMDFLDEFPLKPTLIIHSGNGLHVYWVFQKVWYFDGSDERKKARLLSDRFQNTLIGKAKAKGWDIDETSDLVRLLRLPGTYNYKNPDDPKLVEIIKNNENKYRPEDFEPYLVEPKNESTKPRFDASKIYQGVSHGERNVSIFKYACSRIARGYNPEEIKVLIDEFSSSAKSKACWNTHRNTFEISLHVPSTPV
jgi:hypothetical protein